MPNNEVAMVVYLNSVGEILKVENGDGKLLEKGVSLKEKPMENVDILLTEQYEFLVTRSRVDGRIMGCIHFWCIPICYELDREKFEYALANQKSRMPQP